MRNPGAAPPEGGRARREPRPVTWQENREHETRNLGITEQPCALIIYLGLQFKAHPFLILCALCG